MDDIWHSHSTNSEEYNKKEQKQEMFYFLECQPSISFPNLFVHYAIFLTVCEKMYYVKTTTNLMFVFIKPIIQIEIICKYILCPRQISVKDPIETIAMTPACGALHCLVLS